MTDAQTEARAIEVLSLETPAGNLIDAVRYEDHVAALAAKDAELDGAVFLKDAAEAALRKREVEINKLHAQLAEARKALGALDRMNRGVDWCDQDEQARRWEDARRILEAREGK